MLLRDAQEQVRVLNAARRDFVGGRQHPLATDLADLAVVLERLGGGSAAVWGASIVDKEQTVGLMLLAALGVANELEVDGAEALRATLLKQSP
jgi:hypothetical protein